MEQKSILKQKDSEEVSEGDPLLDTLQISSYLRKEGYNEHALRLQTCGQNFAYFQCNCNSYKFPLRCMSKICYTCSKIRSNDNFKRLINPIKSFRIARSIYDIGLRLMTFTIANSDDLNECIVKLKEGFTHFKNRVYIKDKLIGGLGVIEIKKGNDGKWNAHLHFIIYSRYLDNKPKGKYNGDSRLVYEWKESVGENGTVWINKITNHNNALFYVLKYITKGLEGLSSKEIVEFYKAVKGKRLLFTFGKLYNIKIKKTPYICNKCNSPIFFVELESFIQLLVEHNQSYIKNDTGPPDPEEDWFYV